jgi:lysophospholipase L1-like esterase
VATSPYRVPPARPRPLIVALVLTLIVALAAVGVAGPATASTAIPSTAAQRAELAQWWAPVHFQDVDTSGETALGGKSDYITSYDYDGDLNGLNNWENTSQYPLAAHVYYSVVQTPSFTYLVYMFFHPRDWADGAIDDYEEDASEHENDSEGALVIVANDGSEHGSLKAVITVAHSNFYSWLPDGSDFSSGGADVDGAIATMGSPHDGGHQRPWTAEQASTHAAWAMGATRKPSPDLGDQYRNGDGILYYPGTTAEVPDGPNDRDVQYTLTDIFAPNGMWANRNLTTLFATPNSFAGDDGDNPYGASCGDGAVAGPGTGICDTNAANPPWAWDDGNDLPGAGYIATNPAQLVWDYFNWPGKPASPDLGYTWDAYNGITPSDPTPPSGGHIKVMVVGDSMTQGHEGDWTWRYRLWQWFRDQRVDVDFVGPYTGTQPSDSPAAPAPPPVPGDPPPLPSLPRTSGGYAAGASSFDSDHFAVWGRQAAQDKDLISDQVQQFQPDYLLVGLGFNDMGWVISGPDETLASMKTLVDRARAAKPNIKFALANVPQRTAIGGREDLPISTDTYNQLLNVAIPTWSTATSPVALVDWRGNYSCETSRCPAGYDGLHPNAWGEYQIAHAFETTLHDSYRLGAGVPAVPAQADVPVRPTPVPSNVVAAPSPTGVTVTWDAVYGALGYTVRSRLVGFPDWTESHASPNRFDSTWTVDGQQRDYQVRTDNVDQQSDWSPIRTATAHPQTAPPPVGIVTNATATGVDVTWGAPTGPYTDTIDRYQIITWDKDTPGAFIGGTATRALSVHVDGLLPGHHYTIALVSWNAAGGGLPGFGRSVTIGAGTPPAPTGLQVSDVDATTIQLSWTGSPQAAGYRVWVRNITNGEQSHTNETIIDATTYGVAYLFPGVWNYEFCVTAINGAAESGKSNCVVPPRPPGW